MDLTAIGGLCLIVGIAASSTSKLTLGIVLVPSVFIAVCIGFGADPLSIALWFYRKLCCRRSLLEQLIEEPADIPDLFPAPEQELPGRTEQTNLPQNWLKFHPLNGLQQICDIASGLD